MKLKDTDGFTLIEMIIIMGIIVLLLMIASINLFPIKHKTSLSASVQALITDIRQQQIKSMSSESAQGIHFETETYTLYKGSSYASGNDKFVVNLGDQIQFSSIPPDQQINFAAVSGEITGYQPSANTIVVKNMVTGEQRTLSFNKFGIFFHVQ